MRQRLLGNSAASLRAVVMASCHQDAVLAASCVRAPVNPRTRAPRTLYERQEEEKLRGRAEEPGLVRKSPTGLDDFDSYSDSEEEQSCKMVTCKDWMLDISKLHHSDREYNMQLERLKNAHVVNMEQLEKMYDHKLHLHGVQNTHPSANTDYWSECEQKSSEPTECECCFLKHNVSSSGLSESSLDELSEGEDDSDTNHSISVAEKIGQMWNGFIVEDYIKKTDFVIHQSKQKVKKSKCKEWSHKVTIPQPFDMTIRESMKKEMNVKSKSEIEMENNLLKKRLEEEAECQKKFRANPVPASVYLPLYHEIVERNEERRNFVKDRSKEILQASQRPFLFTEREERKKQKKEMQLDDLPNSVHTFKHFKAKPVPKSIYGTSVNERLKEEELYRQIRIQMRSQELLHSSSYPTSTLACRTSPKSRKTRCQQSKMEESHKPKINTQIPNFRVLHENHEKRFLKNKDTKLVTICDPFQLCTSNLASNKGKILKDIEADEEILKESRWPYKSPRNQLWKSSAGLLPLEDDTVVTPKSTESSKRREQAIRKSLEGKLKQEEDKKKSQTRRREKEKTLKKHISRKARAIHPDQTQKTHSKLKELRKSEKRRTKEYMEELGAMKERVSQTPLLLERASQKNARLCAEKHYSTVLRNLGLCDDFVSVKGQNAALRGLEHSKEDMFRVDNEERSSEGTLEIADLQEYGEDDEIQRNHSGEETYGEYSTDEDHVEEN
ncbi:protein FAM161A isoform X2 [Ranitomeya variabilis]|uniref:protein FAM161A isoform X2 n=1 Tax=Ranitomeya variabilis TaxID=490064 RepID=UPI0040574E13